MNDKHVTDEDTARIGQVVRQAGELIDAHGPLALELTLSWKRGPRSPNLNPDTGGWRYEVITENGEEVTVPIPSDSTGESAVHFDNLDGAHDELQSLLKRLQSDAARVRDIVSAAVPPAVAAGIESVEWCSNHLRIQQCEPRHRGDLCRFCYDFKNLRQKVPPPTILGIRHRYGRVTEKQIEEALSREGKIDETVNRVGDAVQRGRRSVQAPVAAKPQPPESKDPQADIEDRRTKRLRAS